MKGTFIPSLIVVFCMLALPLMSLSNAAEPMQTVSKNESNIVYNNQKNSKVLKSFKVLKNDEILNLSARDYIFGVVAAEMPALYESEALKAQAVAAYTFACYKAAQNGDKQYDISALPEEAQCFITRDEAAQKWGEKTDEYTKKIEACVDSVLGEYISYNGDIIFAAYHAISSGNTNSCNDVWGKELAYLVSADSLGDRLAKGYLSEAVFTADELSQKLNSIAAASGAPQGYFTEITKNDSGYVKALKYCGKETTGSEISKLLELRSANFDIAFAEGVFTFSVRGYGHGVGLSQNGANYMAQQGSSYNEILAHYYKGTTLKK